MFSSVTDKFINNIRLKHNVAINFHICVVLVVFVLTKIEIFLIKGSKDVASEAIFWKFNICDICAGKFCRRHSCWIRRFP